MGKDEDEEEKLDEKIEKIKNIILTDFRDGLEVFIRVAAHIRDGIDMVNEFDEEYEKRAEVADADEDEDAEEAEESWLDDIFDYDKFIRRYFDGTTKE